MALGELLRKLIPTFPRLKKKERRDAHKDFSRFIVPNYEKFWEIHSDVLFANWESIPANRLIRISLKEHEDSNLGECRQVVASVTKTMVIPVLSYEREATEHDKEDLKVWVVATANPKGSDHPEYEAAATALRGHLIQLQEKRM